MANDAVRAEVHYSGHVQGVGFRYTTVAIAGRHAVVGYVQNLSDGRVKLVAEGRLEEVQGLLGAIVERMGDLIHNIEREMISPTGEFVSFEIRR